MNKTTIIIICSFILCLTILLVVLLLIKQKKKKNMFNMIDKLTIDKNMIISPSILTELNKAKKLSNNKKIAASIDEWEKEYSEISNVLVDNISSSIIELENLAIDKKYKDFNELVNTVEKDILHVKAKSNKLLSKIKDLTESEERNIEAITKLKSIYREIVFKYNKDKDDYKEISNSIDLQFENINKLFSGFEVALQENEYEEIGKIVKVLDDLIHNMQVVVDESPSIIMLSKIILPKKMNDIKVYADKLKREGYNLEYLNIDYNIEETNKKINEILDKLNVLNLENSIFDLKTLSNYYEGLYTDFDNEKSSKTNYERGLINITERINNITKTVRNLYGEIDSLKDTYDLTKKEIDTIDEINKELISVKDSFKLINDRSLIKVFPYSKLDNECEMVAVNVSSLEEKLEQTIKNLGSLKEDESRARDQLFEIKAILNDSKHKIKEYNLPVIPERFYIELKEANEAVKEIMIELDKKPISIKTLNLRVDTARDLSLKVYETASKLVKQATIAEGIIVYGNRYRSSNSDIDNGLNVSTKLFYKGKFKESIENSIKSLNEVEPSLYKKILKEEGL